MAEFTLIKPPAKTGSTFTSGPLAIVFDVTEGEIHTQDAEVTMWPVRDEVAISDHIQAKPFSLTIQGIISATPIHDDDAQPERLQDAHIDFIESVSRGDIFTVVTGLVSYENMAVKSYTAARSARSGQALACAVELVQIKIVDEAEVRIPARILNPVSARVSGQSEKDKGPQTGKKPNEKEKKEAGSMAYGLAGGKEGIKSKKDFILGFLN